MICHIYLLHSMPPSHHNFRQRAGWDISPSVGLVIAGGYNLDTAEISYNYGANFTSLPNLPVSVDYNCVVIVGNKVFELLKLKAQAEKACPTPVINATPSA